MRAAVYLRISLDRYGDGLAVDRQREDCLRIIEQRGWDLVEIYEDTMSASVSTKARPGYEQMIRDWSAGRFGAIVCWDLDRLTRQPRQLEDWIDRAEQRGLRLVTANGEADLGTDAGRMFARIKAAVSRQEVDRKSARQVRAAQQRAQRGMGWGPRRPFGFAEDKITHHPTEAPVVARIYSDFLAGVGQREICRQLTAEGIKTTLGNDWTQPVLRSFIRNPRNAGLSTYKGEIVGRAEWDPLVSEATWRSAVSQMDGKRLATPGGARKYLLVGVALCGVCEAPVGTAYTSAGSRQYQCRKGHVSRNGEAVDNYVGSVVKGVLATVGVRSLVRSSTPDESALAAEADALRTRLDSLAVEFADGSLTASQLRTASKRTRDNLEAVENRLAASQRHSALTPFIGASDVSAVWDSLDVARRRAVVETLMTVTINRTSAGAGFNPADVEITPRT